MEASWWLAVTLGWVVLTYWGYRAFLNRFLERKNAAGCLHVGEQSLVLSGTEFSVTSGTLKTLVPYQAVQLVEEDEECVYLGVDDFTIFYIPKHASTATILPELRRRIETCHRSGPAPNP